MPLIVVFSTKKVLLMLCVDVWSKKEFVYLKLLMHQRVVEMIVLSAESEYKLQKHAQHGITVNWLLSFDFITSRAKRPSFLWATQRDDMANLKNWNTKRKRYTDKSIVFNSETSSFLVDLAFKFFMFYLNCNVWVLWQTFFKLFVILFWRNAFHLKKHNIGNCYLPRNVFAFLQLISFQM